MNKKNRILTLLFFVLISFSYQACTPDEEDGEDKDTTKVVEIVDAEVKDPVLKTLDYEAPKELTYGVNDEDFLYDAFFPIGWSEDGHLAYISEPADEATGYYFFTFTILDTKNNKVVWTWKIDEKDGIEDISMKKTWEKNYEKFKKELNFYKIKQQAGQTVEQFPLKSSGNSYEATVKLTKTADPYGLGFDVVDNATVKLKSAKAEKGVLNQNLKEEAFLSYSVLGYVKSPYEEQIVLFIKKEMRGYEGPPNVILFETVGCSLD